MEKVKQHEVLLTTNICLVGILLWILCSYIGALLAVLAVLFLLFPEVRRGILATPQQDKSRPRSAWLDRQKHGEHTIRKRTRAEFNYRGGIARSGHNKAGLSPHARNAGRGPKRFNEFSPEETLALPPRLELRFHLRPYGADGSFSSDRPGSSGYFYDYATSSEDVCSNMLQVAQCPAEASSHRRPPKGEERARIVAWLQGVAQEMPSGWLPRTAPDFPLRRHKTLPQSGPPC